MPPKSALASCAPNIPTKTRNQRTPLLYVSQLEIFSACILSLGIHTTSGANGITINFVDVQDATEVGIRIVLSDNINILSGSSRGDLRDCQQQESTNVNWGSVNYECGVNGGC